MKHKFTLDYLKSIHRDEFIHWTAVHNDIPDSGKWGYCKGYIWNKKLKTFLNENPNITFIKDQQNETPQYISRHFENNKIIIATNDDAGILKVTDKYAKGTNGVLIDNINSYLTHSPSSVNHEAKDLYVITSPEPNGGTFPQICDIFNSPTNVKRIYSKGLMVTDNEKFKVLRPDRQMKFFRVSSKLQHITKY